jgi:hypothetical protein
MTCIDKRAVMALNVNPGALNHSDSLSQSVDIEIAAHSFAERRAIR